MNGTKPGWPGIRPGVMRLPPALPTEKQRKKTTGARPLQIEMILGASQAVGTSP